MQRGPIRRPLIFLLMPILVNLALKLVLVLVLVLVEAAVKLVEKVTAAVKLEPVMDPQSVSTLAILEETSEASVRVHSRQLPF